MPDAYATWQRRLESGMLKGFYWHEQGHSHARTKEQKELEQSLL
jgi:hypothetical protein